ncbi:MAG: EAL domain-containing protein, partial [Magnetococcales bacterium]|nr:EAL domain-containing protein [Magnetococcales bacterium]
MQKNITTQRLFTALSDKELILHYQPILEADSGELSGIESLVRWQSPDLGLVTAKHLVPFLLQDESLSAALDGWTMREALIQAAMWKRQGFRFGSMAVNVLSWYRGRGFVTMVAEALATSGADPRLLALEAHNTMLSAGPLEVLLHTTHALAKQGITLAIDHFSWQPVDLDKVMQIPVHFVKSDAKTLDDWQEADKAKAKK